MDEQPYELELDDDAAEAKPIVIDPEVANLVPLLKATEEGRSVLKQLGQQVTEDFEEAWSGAEEWREKRKDNWKMYSGMLPPKQWPFKHCSNHHVPIALMGINRLASRLYAEFFLGEDNIHTYQPTSPNEDAHELARIRTLHANWQLREGIPDFTRQMHRACTLLMGDGDFTGRSFYDKNRRMNRHVVLSSDDVAMPFVTVATMPDLSDVPYKVHVMRMRKRELLDMRGDWEDVDAVCERAGVAYDDADRPLRSAIAELEGIEQPDATKRNGEYEVLHYDGWFAFPGDERARPITAVVCKNTRTVMRLFVRDEEDWRDRQRFERQRREKADYLEAMSQYQGALVAFGQALQEWERTEALARELAARLQQPDVDERERAVLMDALSRDALPRPQEPQPPVRPAWMTDDASDPSPVRRVPIELWFRAVCIENPTGALGLSPGQVYADFNRAANNALNQFGDQATIANVGGFITADNGAFEPGQLDLVPGGITRLTGVTSLSENTVVPWRAPPANPQLVELVDRLYSYGEAAFGATAALSGEPGKSGETYRGFATRIEQALKQLSVAGRKFADGFTQIIRNNDKLNYLFIEDDEVIGVTDYLTREVVQVRVGKKVYEPTFAIAIRADMRFLSQQQRIQEAMEMINLPQHVPPLQQSLHWWWTSAANYLRAVGRPDMIAALGPRPEPPSTPLGVAPSMPAQPEPGQSATSQPMQPPREEGVPGPRPEIPPESLS
ncbi:MAG: hypothetical protein QN163_10900 [Armatimonadota bacterium]|nr:hypothetical protein [Armatimonadota bacterium]